MAKKEEKNIKDKKSFMKSFKAELKKVIWPTPKQLFNNTIAVLTIVIITAVVVFALDFAFEGMNKYGIDKIKQIISNSVEDETVNATTNSENEIDEVLEQDNVENAVIEENSAE